MSDWPKPGDWVAAHAVLFDGPVRWIAQVLPERVASLAPGDHLLDRGPLDLRPWYHTGPIERPTPEELARVQLASLGAEDAL